MTHSHPLRFLVSNAIMVALTLGCGAPPGGRAPVGDAGSPTVTPGDAATPSPSLEECYDGIDGDSDGLIDQGCPCVDGEEQHCYPGAALTRGVGICSTGLQRCVGGGEFGAWGPCEGAVLPTTEVCGDAIDQDCDGSDLACVGTGDDAGVPFDGGGPEGTDAGGSSGPLTVPINLYGDCVTARCPPEAPYPVGCSVFFSPGDDRGCVASAPTDSVVYFQAGDQCNVGFVSGHLLCSTVPGAPLDDTNCPINKPVQIHVRDRAMCPTTH